MLAYALATLAAILAGVLVAFPMGWIILVAVAGAAWVIAWSLQWRAALLALFLFLPVAAVPGILLQQEGWPALLKDGLFLLPAYLGLAVTVARDRTLRRPLSASLMIPLASLVALIILQALRVMPTYPWVALIGLKTWLAYLPLLIVPAVVFSAVSEVYRMARLLVLVSIVPSLVAVIQFLLIVTGHADLAYQWYGTLAVDVTQGFAQVGVSDQLLVHRVPSTFTFFTQFVAYCLVMVPVCVVTWMADPDARWRQFAAVASVLVIAAGFASGSRTFYLWSPIEVFLILLLLRRNRLQVAAVVVVGVAIAVITIGSQLAQVANFIASLGWDYLVRTNASEFPFVYGAAGLFGLGTGMDTNASRYVLPSHSLPYDVEGWYALTFLELGLPGLILVAFTLSILLGFAWVGVRSTRGSAAAPIAVAAFVIILTTIPNLYKGVSLEYDPLNVYFWSVAGLAIVLPKLPAQVDRSP